MGRMMIGMLVSQLCRCIVRVRSHFVNFSDLPGPKERPKEVAVVVGAGGVQSENEFIIR